MLPHLTVFEHQGLPVGGGGPNALEPAEVDELLRLSEVRRGFCERRYQAVQFAQYCGVVNLGERALEILPKVDANDSAEACRRSLVHMLWVAGRFPTTRDRDVGHRLMRQPLLEVFIWAFLDAVTAVVRAGILRRYEVHESDIRTIRGAIMAARQFGVLANRVDLVACRFDELTDDNEWNRAIKHGLRLVGPWISNVELYARWTELIAVFQDVADIHDLRLQHLVYDRQASRYRLVIDWVKWIVASLSPSIRAGSVQGPGLLFDMNALFQVAVAAKLKERAAGTGFAVSVQDHARYLTSTAEPSPRKAYQLQPDIVLRRGEKVIGIADTKWKRVPLRSGRYLYPSEADVYQMHAYAAAYQCQQIALIYPWYSDLGSSQETTYELPVVGALRPRLTVFCIDIRTPDFVAVRGAEGPLTTCLPESPRVL